MSRILTRDEETRIIAAFRASERAAALGFDGREQMLVYRLAMALHA